MHASPSRLLWLDGQKKKETGGFCSTLNKLVSVYCWEIRAVSVLCATVWDPQQLQDQHQRTCSSAYRPTEPQLYILFLALLLLAVSHNFSSYLICLQGERKAQVIGKSTSRFSLLLQYEELIKKKKGKQWHTITRWHFISCFISTQLTEIFTLLLFTFQNQSD